MIAAQHVRFMQQLGRSYRAFVAGFETHTGQSMARWRILFMLHKCGGTSQKSMARELGINPAALTRQLKALEAQGWVERHIDAHDARRVNVALSDEGRKVVMSTMARRNEFIEWALGDYTGAELESLSDLLLKLETRLSRSDRDP
jgi:Transcriptional regulators